MNITRNIPALTAATLAILTLAACSQDAAVPQASTAPATTASAPAHTQAPDDTATSAVFTTGAAVTDQATIDACQPIGIGIVAYGDLADGKCPLPMGSRLYPMADGSHVVVNQDDPLPEAVTAQVKAQVQSSGGFTITGGSGAATGSAIQEIAKKTGKSWVIVAAGEQSTGAPGEFTTSPAYSAMVQYNSTSTSVDGKIHDTADEAYQSGLAFVAGQAHPERWVVIPYAG